MAQIVSCPQCQKKLQMPEEFLGKLVQCPECQHTFKAAIADPQSDAPLPMEPLANNLKKPGRENTPSSKFDDEDEDDRPRARRRRDTDDDEDGPRRRRRYYAPHRGGMILTLGILAFFCFPFIFGPIAWSMGNSDLTEIRAGRMDPEGEGTTQAGRICGMIATILGIVGMCMFCGIGMLGSMR